MAGLDVKAVRATGTGAATAYRTRVMGITVVTTASAGRVTLTDGSGGATLLDVDFAAVAGTEQISIPGDGILASTGIYIGTLTNISFITVFYA